MTTESGDLAVFGIILATLLILSFVSLMACSSKTEKSENVPHESEVKELSAQPDETIHNLTIDLQSGFSSDHVKILINGKTFVDEVDVTTSLLLGFAKTYSVEIEGPVTVEVGLPKKDLTKSVELNVTADVYLGISIEEGHIQVIISAEPFGYS